MSVQIELGPDDSAEPDPKYPYYRHGPRGCDGCPDADADISGGFFGFSGFHSSLFFITGMQIRTFDLTEHQLGIFETNSNLVVRPFLHFPP